MQMLRFLLIITIVMCMLSGCTKKSGTSNGSTEGVSVTTGESEISETDEGNTISTSQLIDKALQYVKDESMSVDVWEQATYALDYWSKNCEAIAELLERDDYAELIMDIYMNSEPPANEITEANFQAFRMMEFEEVMLSQNSACRQLDASQQKELVRQMTANALKRIAKETFVIHYSSAFIKNIEWYGTDNEWYDTIKNMDLSDFSDEEKQYIENFYERCDGTPRPLDDNQ